MRTVLSGAVVGAALALAPNVVAGTAITDPIWLGLMWFVRTQPFTLVALLLHLLAGGLVGLACRYVPGITPRAAVLVALTVNGAATVTENAYGMGVMGVGGWLLGSVVSAILMLLAVELVGRVPRWTAPRVEAKKETSS